MTGNMALPLIPRAPSLAPLNGHIAKALRKRWSDPQTQHQHQHQHQHHQTLRIPVARLTG